MAPYQKKKKAMGAGNSTSSRNVSKMMQTASIDLSTAVSQSTNTHTSMINMVSQTCSNVGVGNRPAPPPANREEMREELREACTLASKQGKKACAIPWLEKAATKCAAITNKGACKGDCTWTVGEKYDKSSNEGDEGSLIEKGSGTPSYGACSSTKTKNIKWKGGTTWNSNFTVRAGNEEEAEAWCSRSKANCKQCSNTEGDQGVWANQDYDTCVTSFGKDRVGNVVKCGWAKGGKEIPVDGDIKGCKKSTTGSKCISHCVPACEAYGKDQAACYQNPECEFIGGNDGSCRIAKSVLAMAGVVKAAETTSPSLVGCLMEKIDQENSLKMRAKATQDAAIQNGTKQQLKQNLKQVASAMTKGISFGNLTTATNIGTQIASANTSIQNSIKQTCGSSAFMMNSVMQNCDNVSVTGDGDLAGCVMSGVDQTNTADIANDCEQKAVVGNKVIQDLQQAMDQTAVAKNIGVKLTWFIIGYIIIACFLIGFVYKFYAKTLEEGAGLLKKILPYIIPTALLIGGSAMHATAFSRNGAKLSELEETWKRAFYDHHSGSSKNGNYTLATMNMKLNDGWSATNQKPIPTGQACYNQHTKTKIDLSAFSTLETAVETADTTVKEAYDAKFAAAKATAKAEAAVDDAKDAAADNPNDTTAAALVISTTAMFSAAKLAKEVADEKVNEANKDVHAKASALTKAKENACNELNGHWDSTGHYPINAEIQKCKSANDLPKNKREEACRGPCRWKEKDESEDAKCIVNTSKDTWTDTGKCFMKEENVFARDADSWCHDDYKCHGWFWKAYKTFDQMTAFKNRNEPDSIYKWKDGLEDGIIDIAGGFSPDCWGDRKCCDKKDCVASADPESDACKTCCPKGYTAMMIGNKKNSACEGKKYDTGGCTSTDHKDFNIQCSKCDTEKEGFTGTAYYYQKAPSQKRDFLPNVEDKKQVERVAGALSCMAGVTSWGATTMTRNFDFLGISGRLIWTLSVFLIVSIMAGQGANHVKLKFKFDEKSVPLANLKNNLVQTLLTVAKLAVVAGMGFWFYKTTREGLCALDPEGCGDDD